MISKIEKEFTFQTAIHFQNKFMINLYEMNLIMSINTVDPEDQNTAIERLSYFIGSALEDSIFVEDKEKEVIETYAKAGIKVITVPEEPYDQIIGLILLNKFNSIMENRIVVTDMILGSKLSNLIKFHLNDETASLEFSGKHWWNESSTNTENKKSKKDKIVKLFDKKNDWEELELTWKK